MTKSIAKPFTKGYLSPLFRDDLRYKDFLTSSGGVQ